MHRIPQHWEMLLVETLTWIAPVCEITLRIKYFGLPVGLLHVYTLAFWYVRFGGSTFDTDPKSFGSASHTRPSLAHPTHKHTS